MESFTGRLLIAIPDLPDSNFFRTVVFMIDHSDEGAMGVILNRPLNMKVDELWDKLNPNLVVDCDANIYLGGPVKGPVIAIHNDYNFMDNEVIDSVFVTMSSERLNDLITKEEISLRIFTGYSGWGPGQLEMEIESGGWLVADATSRDPFLAPDNLWKNICDRVGRDIIMPKNLLGDGTGDPNLN